MASGADSAWSWVVAGACCWVSLVVQGLVRCGGIVYVALIDNFQISREKASWPFTLRIAFWNVTGPLAAALSHHLTIRAIMMCGGIVTFLGYALCYFTTDVVYITLFFGALQGFGTGLLVTLLPVVINQYFVKFKTTGAGIAMAGATIGSFAMPPLVEYMLKQYGLSGSFLLMSGIILNAVVGIALLRPATWVNGRDSEQNASKEQSKCSLPRRTKYTPLATYENEFLPIKSNSWSTLCHHLHLIGTVLKNPVFLIISSNYVIFFHCYMTYLMVIVDFATDIKIHETKAVFLVSAFSMADMTGRLGSGWITDRGFLRRSNLLMSTMVVMGILLPLTPFAISYEYLVALAIIYGLLVGCTLIVFFALLEEFLGLDNLATAMGLVNFMNGCGAFVTPVLTGHFRDRNGNYDYLFYVLGASSFIGGSLWILRFIYHSFKRKKEVQPQNQN